MHHKTKRAVVSSLLQKIVSHYYSTVYIDNDESELRNQNRYIITTT